MTRTGAGFLTLPSSPTYSLPLNSLPYYPPLFHLGYLSGVLDDNRNMPEDHKHARKRGRQHGISNRRDIKIDAVADRLGQPALSQERKVLEMAGN